MVKYYRTLYERGDLARSARRMSIHLYPDTRNEDYHVWEFSSVVDALKDVGDQLYDASAVDYFELLRFRQTEFRRPNVRDVTNPGGDFQDFLESGNGTGHDLYSIRGCHLLVHGGCCSVNSAGAEGHDKCRYGGDAFSRGVMAWTGVCDDVGLRRNSAIQEPIHSFIRASQTEVRSLFGDDADTETGVDHYDEHSLGKVNRFGEASPLVTYHDHEFEAVGDCPGKKGTADGYTQELTYCTKQAVKFTSHDQCDPQQEPG